MTNANVNTKMGFDELLDLGAVDTLLDKAQKICKKKLSNKVFPGMEKDDVVQEALVKVYNSIDKYDSEKAKASTFFDHIISNVIKDCYKKATTEKNLLVCNASEYTEVSTDSDDVSEGKAGVTYGVVDHEYENSEFMMDLADNMGLNDREKEIFSMRCAGYEFKEIAEVIGVSKPRMTQIWKKIVSKYEAL